MIVNKGEVVTLASGIFESYYCKGPFLAIQNFDLGVFVGEQMSADMTRLEVDDLVEGIPSMLIERGFVVVLPCRKIYLDLWEGIDISLEEGES